MATNVQNERKRLHAEAVKALQALVTHYENTEGIMVTSVEAPLHRVANGAVIPLVRVGLQVS